jgi:hypothetical protein
LQQTPSTQKPLVHSSLPEHVLPVVCFEVQAPLLHHASCAQSLSCAQPVVHAALTHWYGSQSVGVATLVQLPKPSHRWASMTVPTQRLGPHCVVDGASSVPTHVARVLPSQTGVAQTEVPAGQGIRLPCGMPLTGAHVPCSIAMSQASHWPVHAVLQQ